jgi:hypothetical protein
MTHDYSAIDAALPGWLAGHGLHVLTEHRDDEVRIVPVVDDAGTTFQIWFDPAGGDIDVHAWAPAGDPRMRWAKTVRTSDLPMALVEVWSVVDRWIGELGHTRTPYLGRSSGSRDIREH